MEEKKHQKQPWLKLYSIVLIVNLIYVILFYFITQAF